MEDLRENGLLKLLEEAGEVTLKYCNDMKKEIDKINEQER